MKKQLHNDARKRLEAKLEKVRVLTGEQTEAVVGGHIASACSYLSNNSGTTTTTDPTTGAA